MAEDSNSILAAIKQQTQLISTFDLRLQQLGKHKPSSLRENANTFYPSQQQYHLPYAGDQMAHTSSAQQPWWNQGGGPPGNLHAHPPQFNSIQNLEGTDDLSRMARGSAAVQELVGTLENNPMAIIISFENRVRREEGALFQESSWSVSENAERLCTRVPGHISLKKFTVILAHLYQLQRRYGSNPEYPRAFTAQAYKVVSDTLQRGGCWELTWPLLGLADPEEREPQLLSATEKVAVAALHKERKVLQEVVAAVKKSRPPPAKAGAATGDG